MRFLHHTSKISLLATIKLKYDNIYDNILLKIGLFFNFSTFNMLIAISNFIDTYYFLNIFKCKYLEYYCELKKLSQINKSSIQISKTLYNIILSIDNN